MQEMRVQTSSFAPEFGRSPGAQIVMTSRGGSNSLHGSLYDYLRNQRFDANDWFANQSGFARGAERQSRPGGTFGGPIIKNRTFFFVNIEHLSLVSPTSVIASVPNVATRLAASSTLRPFLDAFPLPNGVALDAFTSQYRAVVSNPSSSNTGSLRIDQVINGSTTAFARISYSPSYTQSRASQQITPNVLTFGDVHSETGSAGVTQTFKSGFVNDVRFNYSKYVNDSNSIMDNFGGAIPLTDAEVFPKNVTNTTGAFNLNAFGLAGYSYDNRNENDQAQYNVVDSLSHTAGAHQLKFGGDYRKLLGTTVRKPYSESVSFNGVDGNTNALVTGLALNAQVVSHSPEVYPTYTNYSAYAQDTWRATQWTTITYGLRWDLNPAPTARQGPAPFALSNDPIAGVTQNQPLYQTAWFNVAPRFGIAYNMDERPGHEMMLRAGVGVFYDLGYGVTGGAFNGAPYSNVRTISNVTFPLTIANLNPPGLPATRPYGQVFSADTNLQAPRVIQWNVTWEHSFGVGQVLTLSYVGTQGRNLSRTSTQAAYTAAYDVVTTATNGAESDYNGAQVQFRKRLSSSLQIQAGWTYSHSIDSASSDACGGGFASLFNSGDRGNSDYDIRHVVNVSGTYRIPVPKSGMLYSPIRNWFFDFVGTARTGLPFGIQGISTTTSTVTTSSGTVTTTTAGLFANVRPDYLGQSVWISDPSVPGGRRINLAAFSIPTGFAQGDLGRNVLRGFGEYQLDLGIRKQINLTERVRLNLAAQGYNVTNHPNFANVTPNERWQHVEPELRHRDANAESVVRQRRGHVFVPHGRSAFDGVIDPSSVLNEIVTYHEAQFHFIFPRCNMAVADALLRRRRDRERHPQIQLRRARRFHRVEAVDTTTTTASTTKPIADYSYTGSSTSSHYTGGPVFEMRLTKHIWVGAELSFHHASYAQVTDIRTGKADPNAGTDNRPLTILTDNSMANYWDIPMLVRYRGLRESGKFKRFYPNRRRYIPPRGPRPDGQ